MFICSMIKFPDDGTVALPDSQSRALRRFHHHALHNGLTPNGAPAYGMFFHSNPFRVELMAPYPMIFLLYHTTPLSPGKPL